jgi:hypothetical protein
MNPVAPLARPIFLDWPELTGFVLANFAVAAVTSVILLLLVARAPRRLLRPALLLSGAMHVLYQWPLVLLSQPVEQSMQAPWVFAAVVHAAVLGLAAWIYFSRRLDPVPRPMESPGWSLPEIVVPIALMGGLSAIYLGRVPLQCTALYSLVMDPHLTLLAREFSIKLVGSSLATYSFGAVANAVAPLVVTISFWMLGNALLQRRFIRMTLWALLGFVSITLVLLSGTKGLLVPTMLTLVITSFLWNRRWWSKLVATGAAMAFLGGSVVMVDLVKERDAEAGSNYDFATCSVKLGVCPQSLELMGSLSKRDMSLGMPKSLVRRLDERLVCACDPALQARQCKRVEPLRITRERAAADGDDTVMDEQIRRGFTLLQAIVNRAFVTPMQVAGWHYMYAETEPNPGMAVLPFARRLLGFSANAPERVYQKYGVIYSDGDRTSTSTAPTGFLLMYPAYLGWYGLLLALGLVLIFDVFVTGLVRRLRPAMVPVAAALLAGVCVNFAVSDFVTVLISHGGLMAVALIALMAWLGLWSRHPAPR